MSIILRRLLLLCLAIIALAIAGLNSANARFAIILRDRARSELVDSPNTISDKTFASLMQELLINNVVAALASAAFAIFEIVIAAHPRWLREHDGNWRAFAAQAILALIVLVTGGYLADHVSGFRSSFEKFGRDDNLPYYTIFYYGGVAQAAYGSLTIVLLLLFILVIDGKSTTDKSSQSQTSRFVLTS
ncbi:hypothetical protein GGR51DRAFT_498521 [Nemania sp. FL0031]|nr:hypothetical protein GGR51DRAFT_498521 [Nemania sp. FL0031]